MQLICVFFVLFDDVSLKCVNGLEANLLPLHTCQFIAFYASVAVYTKMLLHC